MRRAGVVHRPGAADDFFAEVAPLLADEGIDLASFDGDVSQLNAALDRATERYNLSLFSPTGEHLAGAIAVLRMFTQARLEGDLERADAILANVQPEATETWPAVSHVIGAGLGRLDEWSREPGVKRVVASAKPQPWNQAAGKAARQILTLAKRGSALAGLQDLILRFSGLAVLEGTAVAVAAVVRGCATSRKISLAEARDELLPGEDELGAPTALAPADHKALDAFGAWIEEEVFEEPVDAEALIDTLAFVFSAARVKDVDPHDPSTMQDLLDALSEVVTDAVEEDDLLDVLHRTLDEYVHFRLATDESPEAWEAAHAVIEAVLFDEEEENPLVGLLEQLAANEEEEERRAALAELPVVQAVPELLAWIGRGRPASPSGAARRADIETVAGMLGIKAIGVNRKPPVSFDDPDDALLPSSEPLSVMAMKEIPELEAWWQALTAAGLLEAAPSRLRPGPEADLWLSEEGAPPESVEMVVGLFVSTLITYEVDTSRSDFFVGWSTMAAQMLMVRLIQAVGPGEALPDLSVPDPLDLLSPRTDRRLAQLARQGLVRITPDGGFEVPDGLRLTVLRGVLSAGAMLRRFMDEDPAGSGFGG